ncbi:MAG: CBS domain-containing protein, partial [Rhodospirillales bacterium]|nr:CBS domain-containing protein [Rhodospirillales bacterium]
MHRKIVPDIVRDQELAIVSETLSVIDAVRLMAKRRIGAVMVAAGDKLTGIFTERDLATKVVAAELDPAKVSLAQVMTRNPDSISPDDTALNALEMMQA